MAHTINLHVAGRLEEAARLLRNQGSDPYRVRAYRRAATVVRGWALPVDEVFRRQGLAGLKAMPAVGPTIARAIRDLVLTGRLPMLERLRGESDPVKVLASVPGVGVVLAERLHDEMGLDTLADLEAAAHDGRLETIAGFGEKRLAGIRDSLAHRLQRVHLPATGGPLPPVSELLDVDRHYRELAEAGRLQLIAPRRFNPARKAWLPILHAVRDHRQYTALYSNTAHAHRAGKTHDWVVLYSKDAAGERSHTVLTAMHGLLRGNRVVAGREGECEAFYAARAA